MSTTISQVMESEISASFDNMSKNIPSTEDEMNMEFNRKNIESLNKVIRLVDSDETTGIDLFCYVHCDPTDSDIRKQCRGVVFKDDELVMKGFPYTIEYTKKMNSKDINNNIVPIFDKCSFYDSYEGALIRMFYYKDKWYLSTNRKLDAYRSKWASKESFGSYFFKALVNAVDSNNELREAIGLKEGEKPSHYGSENPHNKYIEGFQNILDKNKQYMFLLLNSNENRIVCESPTKPTMFHVGTFVNSELRMDEYIHLPYPQELKFSNIDELYNYVNNVDIKKLQGVIVFAPNNIQYKIFNEQYDELYKVRGNEPSIKFRYLQVRMNKEYNDILHKLYPEYTIAFEEYENHIYDIANDILNAYKDRFIKKTYVTVPVEEFQVIRECHKWHLLDRIHNKISLSKVIDILNLQPPTNINRMIRKKISEKLKTPPNTENKNTYKHISLLRKDK